MFVYVVDVSDLFLNFHWLGTTTVMSRSVNNFHKKQNLLFSLLCKNQILQNKP